MVNKISELTRPIIGIENRTAQEVFDIMSDRILSALEPQQEEAEAEPVCWLCTGDKPGHWHEFPHVKFDRETAEERMKSEWWTVVPLYAHPAPVQKVQESQTVSDRMVLAVMERADELEEPMDADLARELLTAALGATNGQ